MFVAYVIAILLFVQTNRYKEEGWKGAYMEWLRTSISVHVKKSVYSGGCSCGCSARTTKTPSSDGIKCDYDHFYEILLLQGDRFVSSSFLTNICGVLRTCHCICIGASWVTHSYQLILPLLDDLLNSMGK